MLFGLAMLVDCLRYQYPWAVGARVVLMMLFMLMASPIACHAITQAAYLDGVRPWRKGEPRR
jgi:multisubunit Na+/H+ antiporter MnhG subunit